MALSDYFIIVSALLNKDNKNHYAYCRINITHLTAPHPMIASFFYKCLYLNTRPQPRLKSTLAKHIQLRILWSLLLGLTGGGHLLLWQWEKWSLVKWNSGHTLFKHFVGCLLSADVDVVFWLYKWDGIESVGMGLSEELLLVAANCVCVRIYF